MCAPATAHEPIGGQNVSPGVSAMELRTATNTGGSRPRPYADSVRASCLCLFGLLVGLTNCLSNGRPSRLVRDVASCRILLNDRDHRHSTLVPRSDHVYPPSFPSLSHSYHHLHHDPDHHQARTVPSLWLQRLTFNVRRPLSIGSFMINHRPERGGARHILQRYELPHN